MGGVGGVGHSPVSSAWARVSGSQKQQHSEDARAGWGQRDPRIPLPRPGPEAWAHPPQESWGRARSPGNWARGFLANWGSLAASQAPRSPPRLTPSAACSGPCTACPKLRSPEGHVVRGRGPSPKAHPPRRHPSIWRSAGRHSHIQSQEGPWAELTLPFPDGETEAGVDSSFPQEHRPQWRKNHQPGSTQARTSRGPGRNPSLQRTGARRGGRLPAGVLGLWASGPHQTPRPQPTAVPTDLRESPASWLLLGRGPRMLTGPQQGFRAAPSLGPPSWIPLWACLRRHFLSRAWRLIPTPPSLQMAGTQNLLSALGDGSEPGQGPACTCREACTCVACPPAPTLAWGHPGDHSRFPGPAWQL